MPTEDDHAARVWASRQAGPMDTRQRVLFLVHDGHFDVDLYTSISLGLCQRPTVSIQI